MIKITIEDGFRMTLPEELRSTLCVGDELLASQDDDGRIILTAKAEMRQALDEAFGIWADRTDIPKDGVEYVNQIRNDGRFDEIRKRLHEAT